MRTIRSPSASSDHRSDRLVALATEDQQQRLVAANEHAAHGQLGQDAGTVAAVEPLGVLLAETPQQVESLLDTFWGMNQNLLVQEYIRESSGRDVRALIVGGQVVAAMRRTALAGEFRSNIHRGGAGSLIDLEPEYERLAVQATAIVGLQVAGVDLLESSRGPKVIEINSSPGFEGLEAAGSRDIAGTIVRYAVDYARQKMRGRRSMAIVRVRASRVNGRRAAARRARQLT